MLRREQTCLWDSLSRAQRDSLLGSGGLGVLLHELERRLDLRRLVGTLALQELRLAQLVEQLLEREVLAPLALELPFRLVGLLRQLALQLRDLSAERLDETLIALDLTPQLEK